jgi:hypothetical protein
MLIHRATLSVRRVVPWAVALALGLTMLSAVPASAAAPTFQAVFSPAASSNGGASENYSLSVSSNQGTISAVTVTAPTGFSIVTHAGLASQITFSGLKISGSTVQTLQFTAWAACTAGSYSWTVDAAQKDGTHYVPVTASSTVTSTSSCSASFVGDPTIASAVLNHIITRVPYSAERFGPPDPSPLVSVEVLRGDGVRDVSYVGAIDLSIANDPGPDPDPNPATLTGGDPVAAVAGLAAFSPSIDEQGGGYVLAATAAGVPGPPAASDFFSIQTEFTGCSNNTPCTTDPITGTDITTQATANTPTNGNVLTSGVALGDLACDAYDEASTDEVTTEYTGTGTVVVTDLLPKAIVHSDINNGISQIFTCFRQDGFFTALNGPAVPDPNHPGFFIGLLAPCKKKNPVAPCEISKNETNSGVGVIKYLINAGDPGSRH